MVIEKGKNGVVCPYVFSWALENAQEATEVEARSSSKQAWSTP
jgi:hypothetical protein